MKIDFRKTHKIYIRKSGTPPTPESRCWVVIVNVKGKWCHNRFKRFDNAIKRANALLKERKRNLK